MKLQVSNLWTFSQEPQGPRGCYFFQGLTHDSSSLILLQSENIYFF